MYYVAQVIRDQCSKFNCKQCTLFCPEPNTLMYTDDGHHAFVITQRCKGCALCVYVCSDLLKRDAIEMVYAENRDVAGVR